MARRRATMGQTWPLTTGNNDDPTLTQGSATTYYLNTVPDRAPGGLAYRLTGVLLTISSTLTQTASATSKIYWDQIKPALITSVNWIQSFFGTVVSSDEVLGGNLPIVEFVGGGNQYPVFQRPPIPTTAGAYPFDLTVFIPAANTALGDLLVDTSNLALLFQTSQLKVNVAASSVLNSISTGATFGTITARASAVLEPTNELVLGTPVEWINHQIVAGTSSAQVQIKGFGNGSHMKGVQDKGGVLWLGELTSANQQNGVFTCDNVTQVSFPWRNQEQQNHIIAVIAQMRQTLPNWREQAQPTVIAGGDSNFASYPYANNTSDQPTTTSTNMDLKGLLFWPLVHPGDDVQLTDLQTADQDQSYFLTVTGGFSSGSHQVMAAYARPFLQSMRNNWVGLMMRGGDASLAAHVLGPKYAQATIVQRIPSGRHVVTDDQMTYQPWQLVAPQ